MVMLVDLETTKVRLRIDNDAEDDDLELLIRGASASVLAYLNYGLDYYNDSTGEAVDVPELVQNAVLLLIGILYRDRDGEEADKWEQGYLPRPVTSILYPLRDPALA